MSSMRRRSPPYDSRDRDAPRSNMRMDRKPNATRISDPSHPAGKRKEIDNVMKKARQAPPNEYWDKKLLEAEEKDPNRWKHTGYKKMYVNGAPRKSRSRSPIRKTPVSPHRSGRNFPPQSPVRRRMSRTPERYKPRSPPPRYQREMVKPKEMYRPGGKSRPMSPPPKAARTPSISSCSDDSCSVCSSDDGRRISDKRLSERSHHGPMNRMPRPISPDLVPTKKNKLKVMSPKRRHLKRPVSVEKSSRRAEPSLTLKKKDKGDKLRTRVKVEGEKRRRTPSSASDDSSDSAASFPALTATTRITLSERFGKMAQWNNDRKYDMSNMKITKDMNSEGGDRSAVMIHEQQIRDSPPMRSFTQYSGPEGHFPEEILKQSSAQALGLNAWDDVRVRFDYYKSKGYLRDLTLQDYEQWENWWYRYQEWLKQERYFEMVERNMMRRRRKKIPIQQRLN